MAQDKEDTYRTDEKSTTRTGSDLPHGDGTVSDEDTNKVAGAQRNTHKKGGQDHSLDNYEDSEPTSGVGSFQNSSDTSTDIAHIKDDKGK